MSSLGDLLLGKSRDRSPPSPRGRPPSEELKQQQQRQQDVEQRTTQHFEDGDDSASQGVEDSSSNAQKVFYQRIVKNEVEETQSNASSTDDYVRELLDPNDRPRNVWHVVEGPKESMEDEQMPPSPPPPPSDDDNQDGDRAPDRLGDNLQQKTNDDDDDDELRAKEADTNFSSYDHKSDDRHKEADRVDDSRIGEEPGRGRSARHEDDIDPDRRHRDRSREKSSSSHRHRRDKDSRDRRRRRDSRERDSSRHRHRSDKHSGSRSSRSRRYDYSDDDDDDYYDRSKRSRHHKKSSRSRSPSSKSRRDRSRSDSRSRSRSPITRRNSRTVLVMQLSSRVVTRDLETFFKDQVGGVREVRLIMDSHTRRHKGIAYIEFDDAARATKALALSGQRLCGVPMMIQSALSEKNSKGDHHTSSSSKYSASNHVSTHHSNSSRSHVPPNSYRVYVGSLHVALTEEMIRSVFEPFGPIIKCELMKDRATGVSRGYCFLTYANAEDGQHAVRCLDGFELAGKNLRVSKSAEKGESH